MSHSVKYFRHTYVRDGDLLSIYNNYSDKPELEVQLRFTDDGEIRFIVPPHEALMRIELWHHEIYRLADVHHFADNHHETYSALMRHIPPEWIRDEGDVRSHLQDIAKGDSKVRGIGSKGRTVLAEVLHYAQPR